MNPILLLLYAAGGLYLYSKSTKKKYSGTGGSGGGEGPTQGVSSWIHNGIKFDYVAKTKKLTATYAGVSYTVGTFASLEAAQKGAMVWLPPPTPDTGGDQPKPKVTHVSWVDHGIKFVWEEATGELLAYHHVALDNSVSDEEIEELVGTFDTQQEAHQYSLGWVPYGS